MLFTKVIAYNLLKSVPQISLSSNIIFRQSSNADTLKPVKLSYATYESTTSDRSNQAAPLVIMHGLFGSKSNWNSLCKVYQQKCHPQRKIVAIDSRNHGDSPHSDEHTYAHLAADIKALLEQLGIEKAALLGHSMGGRAVMLFALKYPELVDRLIVEDISPITTSPNLDSMPSLFQAMEGVTLPSSIPMSQARAMVDEQLTKYIFNKPLRAFLLTNLVATDSGSYTWRINIPVLMKNFNNVARFPIVNDVCYDGPVLFVAGKESDFVVDLLQRAPTMPVLINHCHQILVSPSKMFSHQPIQTLTKNLNKTVINIIRNNLLPAKYIMPVENIDLAYASYQSTQSFNETHPEPTPVVILHDFMSSKNNWNSFCKKCHELSKFKVVAVDARNHGDSPHSKNHTYDSLVLDIRQFLHKMGMQKCNLLGHSMGGSTAMLFALKYPDLVEKLIVADASPISTSNGMKQIPQLLTFLKKLDIPETVALSQARKEAAEKLIGFMKDPNAVMFLVTNLVQPSEGSYGWRFNIDALLNNFDYISTFPIIHNITYDGPVLFVGGEKSDFIQKSDYPKIQKLFPNAELTYIEGAGHWLHSEKPSEFLKITLEFLNSK